MNRRNFIAGMAVPAALPVHARNSGSNYRLTGFEPGPAPCIALSHVGFLPQSRKTFVYRVTNGEPPASFAVRELGYRQNGLNLELPLHKVASDFGTHLIADFSQVDREALYVAIAGGERSVPFLVRKDAWRRTLPKAVGYHHAQRCGVAVPNMHPACHLDDALRRDNSEHVDVTGGWHDAGDVRKWMDVTMTAAIGLSYIALHLGPEWDLAGSGLSPLLEEIQWGNRYFLKMQNSEGSVWADAAGGMDGDNSDNHWTDNRIGTSDDRHINVTISSQVQAIFILVQALAAQVFRFHDPGYGQYCLDAARRCWAAAKPEGGTLELGWWLLAAVEFDRACGGNGDYRTTAYAIAHRLLNLQNTSYIGSQKQIRGFWWDTDAKTHPFKSAFFSAMAPLALLEAAKMYPTHPEAGHWLDAVRLHLDEYVKPLTSRSAYQIMPYGIFLNPSPRDRYRPLEGEVYYRYFDDRIEHGWAGGVNSHVENYALLLATAAESFRQESCRDLAYRHLEWVMGANPFGACLMSGEGFRNPYPFSVLSGLIPGGIMNGVSGNLRDDPVLSFDCGNDYRTNEYWTPHSAFYEWTLSVLEKRHDSDPG